MSTELAAEVASSCFSKGLNCAESVLMGVAKALEIDCECIPKIATGLGAGIARTDEVCGAVSGAVMAIGLKYGRVDENDTGARDRVYPLVARFTEEFRKEFGCLRCTDLTGCNLSTPEGMKEFAERKLHAELCAKYVAFAAAETYRIMTVEP